jgi:hypothetical protein
MRACVYARVRVRVCVLATLLRVRICACACRPSACVVALKRAWLAVPSHTHARREMSDGMPSCHTVQDVLDGVPRERQEDAHGLRAEKAQVRLRAGGLPHGVFCVRSVPSHLQPVCLRPVTLPDGPPRPTSAPGLGSPRPTSAPGLGLPRPTSAPGRLGQAHPTRMLSRTRCIVMMPRTLHRYNAAPMTAPALPTRNRRRCARCTSC